MLSLRPLSDNRSSISPRSPGKSVGWGDMDPMDPMDQMKTTQPTPVPKTRLSEFDDDWGEYDFDADDDVSTSAAVFEDESQHCYKKACRELSITTNKQVKEGLRTDKLVLRNQGLSNKDVRAMGIGLLRNTTIESLVLDSNSLEQKAVDILADILPHKFEITELNISNNSLGEHGAIALCGVLVSNSTLKKVTLSGNKFTERDAPHFKEVLEENNSIVELDLSHNEFRERGGEIIAEGLAKNDSIRELDLSWNHLRMRGAIAIGKCLETNTNLEELRLGWNGFSLRGCTAIGKALEVNSSLRTLDLSCNRVGEVGVAQLLKGLMLNTALKRLKLAQNPICPDGALALLKVIEKHKAMPISLLDLGSQSVTEEFMSLKSPLEQQRGMDILHGHVLRPEMDFNAIQDELDEVAEKSIGDLLEENPLTVLFEFAKQQNFRLLDMFSVIDSDNSGSLDISELENALIKVNIPLPKQVISRLVKNMDINGDGVVDYSELVSGHKQYKEKVQAALKPGEFAESEIGRIGVKIREVMRQKYRMRQF